MAPFFGNAVAGMIFRKLGFSDSEYAKMTQKGSAALSVSGVRKQLAPGCVWTAAPEPKRHEEPSAKPSGVQQGDWAHES